MRESVCGGRPTLGGSLTPIITTRRAAAARFLNVASGAKVSNRPKADVETVSESAFINGRSGGGESGRSAASATVGEKITLFFGKCSLDVPATPSYSVHFSSPKSSG